MTNFNERLAPRPLSDSDEAGKLVEKSQFSPERSGDLSKEDAEEFRGLISDTEQFIQEHYSKFTPEQRKAADEFRRIVQKEYYVIDQLIMGAGLALILVAKALIFISPFVVGIGAGLLVDKGMRALADRWKKLEDKVSLEVNETQEEESSERRE